MADNDEIECLACGWQGLWDELTCSEEDMCSSVSVPASSFNICPQCGAVGQCEDITDEG